MSEMIVVRYATLVALVIWLGVMVRRAVRRPLRAARRLLPYACGAMVVVGLFVLKFLGPPPIGLRAPRGAIAVADAGDRASPRRSSRRARRRNLAALTVNIGLGFLLLIWYVRE